MTNTPADQIAPPAPPELGTIGWFNAPKRIGVIICGDGSRIFIPPYGLAKGQAALSAGQPVSFVVRTSAKGSFATEVTAMGEAPADLAAQLATDLGETSTQAIVQVRRIIMELGLEVAQHYLAEAQRVEAAGGMRVPDGSRRRTLGGVFFVLVRQSLPQAQQAIIFPPFSARKKKKAAPAAALALKPPPAPPAALALKPPPAPIFSWDERISIIETLKTLSGKATSVKVTLIGRPDRIEERPQVTLLTLTYTGPLPAAPKGVPTPNPVPATTYSVYIGKKQWNTVAAAITNPEDRLIVEGTQVLDLATGTIAVFATKTTTKLLQLASKQPRLAADEAAPGGPETA